MKKGFNAYFWILILIILLAIWISYTSRPDSNNMLETIYDAIESQEIESVVTIYPGSVSPTGTVETVIDGVKITAHVTNVDDVAQMCLEKNVPVYVTSADEGSWMDYLIPVLIGIGVVMFLFILFTGTVGGGGLGDVAIQYGYYRYQFDIMIVTVILLVAIVQVFQFAGMRLASRLDRRKA